MRRKKPDPTEIPERLLSCPHCSTYPKSDGTVARCPNCGFHVTLSSKEGTEVQQWNRAVVSIERATAKKHTIHNGRSYSENLKRNTYRPSRNSLSRADETERYNGYGDQCSERQSRQRLGLEDCSSQRSERTNLDKYL